MSNPDMLRDLQRLGELLTDNDVQMWPETNERGFMKLLEMRNLLTALWPNISAALTSTTCTDRT